ncbi:putative HMP/thiamine import ATP-binding protein YkoD [Oxobacter pfennigii]|uniref:Putative HMP/thiamine import ATP-binding protein YkoD n=1 Tax=Oxobacter pfennigii TaxID=36849 RepID=A0A0P8WMX4_9CLOT|nr:ABC transporter ATP-binding protein [Oxobacter pfennigii]KPU43875.1 putative HMP/thiamine import ATP-binding protein YkoD [Oxobacter pfennigii]
MINIENLSFRYKRGHNDAGVSDINLHIGDGEMVLLCGESGCGKTTLTRLINGLVPHYFEGEQRGSVRVCGKNVGDSSLHELSRIVGSVFQNPRSQFFTVDTYSELAFGCENLGLPVKEIKKQVEETIAFMNIEKLMGRSIFDLSGGEKQKLACASVWAAHPKVLVLDEPSANLDDRAIADLQGVLKKCKAAGVTIIIAEHRLYYLKGLADRVLYLKEGRIAKEFEAGAFYSMGEKLRLKLGLRGLEPPALSGRVNSCEPDNTTVLLNFAFRYGRQGSGIKVPRAWVPSNCVAAVTGENGAGKTTLVRCLCGLEKKAAGELVIAGKGLKGKDRLKNCYLVMQDVNHQLFCESVLDEVLISMPHPDKDKAYNLLESLDLKQFSGEHPLSLSGGQKQRAAVACAVASERRVILFDEPTSGLDLRHMGEVASVIGKLAQSGKTVIVATHDKEFIQCCCTHVLYMEKGTITANITLKENSCKNGVAI